MDYHSYSQPSPKYSKSDSDKVSRSSMLQERIKSLENHILLLNKRLEAMEKNSGIRIKWGVRYSQRIAFLANVLLGLWHVWSEFVALLQLRRKSILQSLLQNNKTKEMINSAFTESYQFSVWRSTFYFICALLIFSKYSWKRTSGLAMSCLGISYFQSNYFVGNYFTFFANCLYWTAAWSCSNDTVRDPENEPDSLDFWNSLRKYLVLSFFSDGAGNGEHSSSSNSAPLSSRTPRKDSQEK